MSAGLEVLDPREGVERLERLLSFNLPAFNAAFMDGRLTTPEFVDLLFGTERLTAAIAGGGLDQSWRLRAQTALGFLVGSIEHHVQVDGEAPGAGIRRFAGLPEALLAVAADDLPWRDTAMTFWIHNRRFHGREGSLRYTPEDGEVHFNDAVNAVYGALDESCQLMRAMIDGHVRLGSTVGADAMAEVVQRLHAAQVAYLDVRRRRPDGQMAVTPEFFYSRFRVYLPATELGGRLLQGPNAAWLPPIFSLDSLLGTAMPWYEQYAFEKFAYLSASEQQMVRRDIDSPSVLDTLARELRLPAGLASVDPTELARRIVAAGPATAAATRALRDALLTVNKGTRAHRNLVRSHLDEPAASLTPEDLGKLPVKPDIGTGGGTRSHLDDIGEMRAACVPATALITAVALVDVHPRGAAA